MGINIISNKDCCGCTACESICTHHAIIMQPDSMGFLYPSIDTTKCIDCGLCEKVCQFHPSYKRYENYDVPLVYALRLKDADQLIRSQSGGAFYGIAQHIVDKKGVVYGVSFDEEWRVVHQRVSNADELEKLRMSKYVQSDIRGVFKLIKEDLKKGLTVLFSGTACQTAGLKAFLPHKLHENLICVDIICHGVPSPKIWEDYIVYLQKKYKSTIVNACFRDKRFGWHGAKETFRFENGKEIVRRTSNRLYFSGLTMRESCANCQFTNLKRVGDLTIGDFWGLPKDSPYEKDKKGLSLLLVNSDKGNAIFESIRDNFIVEESNTRDCLQPQLRYPSKMASLHDSFVKDYLGHGFVYVAKKYGDIGWRFGMKELCRSVRTQCGNILRFCGLRR